MSLPKEEKNNGALPIPDDESNERNYNPKPKGNPPSGLRIVGGIILLMIVIIPSALFWGGFSFDNSADNVKIKADGCELTGTGSIKISVIISNSNNFPVIVEWQGNGQVGYAKVPAKTQVSDEVYSYRSADSCTRSIIDVTRN